MEFKLLEPKKQNRFIVKFKEPFNIPEFTVFKTTRPSLIRSNNGLKWNNMVFQIYDPIGPSTSQVIFEGLEKLKKQDSKITNITIQILGPVGDIVEDWTITGEIESIDLGQLDWKSDELLIINLYFKVHDVVLNY